MLATAVIGQNNANTITYANGVFTLTSSLGVERVKVDPGLVPMNMSTGRLWLPIDKVVVTFDHQGLGIRRNNKASYSTFSPIATSTDIMSKDAADDVNRAVANGTKTLEVSSISGWEKIGNDLYLLLRWEDSKGATWLEALTKTSFKNGNPTTTLLGKFEGFSTAKGRVNDKLNLNDNKLTVPTLQGNELGVETYDIASGLFSRLGVGEVNIEDAKIIEGSRYGFTIKMSPAKTYLIGLFDTTQGQHEMAAEIRGSLVNVYKPSILCYLRGNQKVLVNLMTGAEIALPRDVEIREVTQGLLIWTPGDKPTQATLYTYGGFRTIAGWKQVPK
ncbi:MAG: hypothetical protein KDC26_02725 [Armatimonadetes bacterium]|nr:hypothetical protein [Armatimonadota bacterium]